MVAIISASSSCFCSELYDGHSAIALVKFTSVGRIMITRVLEGDGSTVAILVHMGDFAQFESYLLGGAVYLWSISHTIQFYIMLLPNPSMIYLSNMRELTRCISLQLQPQSGIGMERRPFQAKGGLPIVK